jgi:hypothetical protein
VDIVILTRTLTKALGNETRFVRAVMLDLVNLLQRKQVVIIKIINNAKGSRANMILQLLPLRDFLFICFVAGGGVMIC